MLLLRHASAGERLSSPSLDRERSLDSRGRDDAERLSGALAGHLIQRLLTSPHVRCVETVQPLAVDRGLALERRWELGPDAPVEQTRALLDQLPADTLVCTHREVIEQLFGPGLECEKGGAWLLERADGSWSPKAYFPPPSGVKLERARITIG